MKPPNSWTPEEAQQAEEYAQGDPSAKDVIGALAEYKKHVAGRASIIGHESYTRDSFTPEHRPTGMMGLRTLLPEILGGVATQHQDPSLAEFKKANPTGGPQAYQDFKDSSWAKAYDEAKARGVPISRKTLTPEMQAQMDEGEAAMRTRHQDQIIKPILGSVMAAGNGATAGALGPLAKSVMSPADAKYLDESEQAAPELVKDAAGMVGAIRSPLFGGAAKALDEALGPAEGVVGGMAKGAVSGAALGAGANVIGGAAKGLEAAARDGRNVGALQRLKDTGADIAVGTPFAATVGALYGAMPGAAKGFSGGLRVPSDLSVATPAQRSLSAAETVGARTSVGAKGGVKPPPTLSALMSGKGPFDHPNTVAMDAAEGPLARGVAAHIDETTSPMEAHAEAYNAAADRMKASASAKPMTRALADLIRERSYQPTEGGELPMVKNAPLIEQLHKTAEPSLAVTHDARAMEQTGAVVVPLDEAIASGMVDSKKALKFRGKLPASDRATMPPGPDDAAAAAYLAKAGPAGGGGLPGVRSNTEQRAAVRLLGQHMNGNTPPRRIGPTLVSPDSLDPSNYSVVFSPRDLTARETEQVIGGVDRAAGISEAEGAGRADPAFKRLPRAAREMRDQLPAIPGITDKYPDVTIQGPSGEAQVLTGRSAMAHAHHEALSGMQRGLKQAGLPSEQFDPTDVLAQRKMRPALQRVGVQEDNTTQALQALAAKGDRAGQPGSKAAFLQQGLSGVEIPQSGMRPESTKYLKGGGQAHGGPVRLGVQPDGTVQVIDGRHRLSIAREQGKSTVDAQVYGYDADGNVVWQHKGEVPLNAQPRASGRRAIDDVLASRLLNGGELSAKDAANPIGKNPARAAAQLVHSVKYRIDPIAEFLGRGAPAAGFVGPKMADPVTNALLGLAARTRQEHR